MIGNDVIDLIAARSESNWQRRGFLQKLFTEAEQEAIHAFAEPGLMVWILWSMKESAYKIYNRETGHRAFIPHLLECSINDTRPFNGIVTLHNKKYYTTTIVHKEMIHTVAVEDTDKIERIYEINQEEVLKDASDLPYALIQQSSIPVPVSVSHHGRFQKIVCIR